MLPTLVLRLYRKENLYPSFLICWTYLQPAQHWSLTNQGQGLGKVEDWHDLIITSWVKLKSLEVFAITKLPQFENMLLFPKKYYHVLKRTNYSKADDDIKQFILMYKIYLL